MNAWMADLRLALRTLRRQPAFTTCAVLALAIGLGVNAVAFSVVNAFLFRPRAGFDVEGAGRVMMTGGGTTEDGTSVAVYERLTAGTAGVLQTAAQGRASLAWTQGGHSETVWALLVSNRFFSILETRPLAGRLLSTADSPGSPAAVVSERFWRERLESAELRSLRLVLNGVDTPVVGVLPDTFEGPGGLYAPQIWVPFEARRTFQLSARLEEPQVAWLGVIARLAPGVSTAEVDARLQTAAAALANDDPATHARLSARFAPMRERVPEVRAAAWVAAAGMAAVGLVLLIACFNVANLLLARAVDRQRETAIRAAIGASRWRVVRLHLTEGLVIAALAGVAATVVALWSQRLASAFAIPIPQPQRVNLSADVRVIGFIALAALAAGVLPAIAPALQGVRLDLVRALTASGHGWRGGSLSRLRQGLMLVQIAGSTAFLVVAALFVQSFASSGQVDAGFETERAIVMTVNPASQGYDPTRARLTIDRLLERVRALPGVTHAAVATQLPFYIGFPRLTEVSETSEPCAGGGCPTVDTYGIGAGYFDTLNVPMLAGADASERSGADGIVVNQAFAERWFPGGEAVGRVVLLGTTGERRVITGVSRDAAQRGLFERPKPALFLPMVAADYERAVSIFLRTAGPPAPLVRQVAAALNDVDSRLAPESVMTMSERLEVPRWPMRAGSLFFGTCGALALFLATIGLAALMAHAVSRRTRELGIRLAIGATTRQLIADVLVSALYVVGPGIVAGVVLAALFARSVRLALVGVDGGNLSVYAAIALFQGAIALLACLVPARRAARVDPLLALRVD